MIPDNELSSKPVRASYMYPDGVVLAKLTEDYEQGGIALQDPSRGLLYQPWFGYWRESDGAVCLRPGITGEDIVLFYEPDVFEMTFTFDQNMRWACATQRTDGSFRLRWYDTAAQMYVISMLEGVLSSFLALDDKRQIMVQIGKSDMLLTYLKGNSLYIRNQRERFNVEHLLQSDLPKNLRITNFGMSDRLRMQWRLRYRRPEEIQPWLP